MTGHTEHLGSESHQMRERRVAAAEILAAFDSLADIYAHVPPLLMWRAWELAVYRHHRLAEPVLDLGCGDGRFFRRTWGALADVVGVDADEGVVDGARRVGLYREVHHAPAHLLPFADRAFASVFANCAVEHMDHLDAVLAEVARVLQPGGTFLLSVVTDSFAEWGPLRAVLSACATPEIADRAQQVHRDYHHLVNALPLADWVTRLAAAGLATEEWSPLVQGPAGWIFLLMDQLWHMPQPDGEYGEQFMTTMRTLPNLEAGSRLIFEGLLELSPSGGTPAGLVLCARK
jgi:SAM-dependent methyltransferase